jgi:hypothetical protein
MKKKSFGFALVLFALVVGTAFAAYTPDDGYYTSKDNGYKILIRSLGYGKYYIQYFTPNGGILLTSQGEIKNDFYLHFTDDAGNACSITLLGSRRFACRVTGGTFTWSRNP